MIPDCGVTATHVDHIVPFHLGGEDSFDNLQSLCAEHHATKSGQEGASARTAKYHGQKRQPEAHPGLM